MPFNGSNTFSIINTFVPGTTILSSAVNANFTDIATGLSDCVTRDAQGAVTGNLLFSSTGYIQLPAGTTGQRPGTALAAYFRYNTTTAAPEFFDGTNWDSLSPTVAQPQGYLTLTNLASGGPITSSDVAAATSVYYSPYLGQLCPVYNGTLFINQTFTEQTLTLVSNHLASTIYDVFAFLNSGTFTIGTGPAWSNSAAGSGARGTGAGTTQLQRINGVLTNQVQITARNGSSTYTVAANQGTYLGSIFIDGSAGQVTCRVTYGQSRKWGVWNAYNRVPVTLQVGDSTASWTYSTNTVRASNGNSANSGTLFAGLAEEITTARFMQNVSANSAGFVANIGIGFNVTNAFSSFVGKMYMPSSATSGLQTAYSEYIAVPSIGINSINCLENYPLIPNAGNFAGTSTNMLMTITWRA